MYTSAMDTAKENITHELSRLAPNDAITILKDTLDSFKRAAQNYNTEVYF